MMLDPWFPIVVRAIVTAAVVVAASSLAEFVGPFGGALVASLPVATGPAYVFMAMEHNSGFVADAALHSFAANAATAGFLLTYAHLAPRFRLAVSLGLAVLAWLAGILAIGLVTFSPASALLLNLVVYGTAFAIARTASPVQSAATTRTASSRSDLVFRAAAVAIFVTCIVAVSSALGPGVTGLMTTFPITFASVICILHPRSGGATVARLATTALRSMLGFGLMLLVLHLAIPRAGVVWALLAALLVTLSWSGGMMALKWRGRDLRPKQVAD